MNRLQLLTLAVLVRDGKIPVAVFADALEEANHAAAEVVRLLADREGMKCLTYRKQAYNEFCDLDGSI